MSNLLPPLSRRETRERKFAANLFSSLRIKADAAVEPCSLDFVSQLKIFVVAALAPT